MRIIKSFLIILLVLAAIIPAGCAEKEEGPAQEVDIGTPLPELTAGPTAVPTEVPEPTDTPEPTPPVDPDPEHPYYLYVEKGSFTLTIFGKDENFNYTVVVNRYRIAHGGTRTPTGIFTLAGEEDRERWHDFPLGGSAQYATPYWGNLFIHSPMYGSQNPSKIWPRYYNGEMGIGTENTGGCLRMVTEAAKLIYKYCPPGTKLEIVNGSPKGTQSPEPPPITKKGYDPTDKEALEAAGGN